MQLPMNHQPSLEQDRGHLKILSIFYYVFGGLGVMGGCCSSIYILLGVMALVDPSSMADDAGPPPPEGLGVIFIVLGGCLMAVLWAIAALDLYAGYCLATQRHRTFCFVMAAISCLSVPLGTILGVFTMVVLSRPGAAALFEQNRT